MARTWIELDDALDATLDAVCAEQGRDKSEVVKDILTRYLETQRERRACVDPAHVELYHDLAGADVALAEEGLADYQRMLQETDRA